MTPKLPLNLKLKKKTQRDLAYAQDVLVEELYNFFPQAIIHGGTAIWRCYNGNRFSEDLDAYIPKDKKIIEDFFTHLEKKGFRIIKKKIKENSVYSELIYNDISIRFEATFQTKKFIFKKYETSESFFINVYTLTPEEFIKEKVDAYLKRRKIRDLYDIYFLLNYIEDINEIKENLKKLIKNFENPIDEENLAVIIISGSVPNFKQLLEEIKRQIRWEK